MVMLRLKLACALVMSMSMVVSVSEAAAATGFCPWRTCGANSDPSIRFPFRLGADALSSRCYSTYQKFIFKCRENTLYLNITENITLSLDQYKVAKIDYWDQTLSLVPQGSAVTCRDFDANRFGGMNITNTTSLLLNCPGVVEGSECTELANFSDPCDSSGSGVVNPVRQPAWACPMTLESFRDPKFSRCKLFETVPQTPLNIPNATYLLVLQFEADRSTFTGARKRCFCLLQLELTWALLRLRADRSYTNFTSQLVPSPAPVATAGDADGARVEDVKGKKRILYIVLG